MIPIIDISTWEIVKWFVVFAELIYLVFAFVIVKQVKVMLETLEIGFARPVKYVSYLHFLFALGIIILSVLIL
jgi:hypothetical protein